MSELLHTQCPDIILCQETKVDQHISSNELFPKDLVTFQKERNTAQEVAFASQPIGNSG